MEKRTIIRDTYTPILDKISTMPIEILRYNISHGKISTAGFKEYIYENDEKIAAGWCNLKVKLSQTSYYTKMQNSAGVSYDKKTKKFAVWGKDTLRDRLDLFELLIDYLHIDWFKLLDTYPKYKNLPIKHMLTKTLCGHILSGKVKNPEEFIKDFMTISHKRKDIPWKLVRDYLNNFNNKNRFMYITLHNIFNYATNPISALHRLTYSEYDDTYCATLNDVLEQCFIFNKKVNFSWSINRLNEEHENMTNQLMEFELKEKDNTPIEYEGYLPLMDGMTILNSEYETYREATYMHNCIYSNYWRRIKKKQYMGIKYVKEGVHYDIGIFLPSTRATTFRRWNIGGVNQDYNKALIDQIKGVRNSNPPQEVIDEINEWFQRENVQYFFNQQKEVEEENVNVENVAFDIALPF